MYITHNNSKHPEIRVFFYYSCVSLAFVLYNCETIKGAKILRSDGLVLLFVKDQFCKLIPQQEGKSTRQRLES